MIIVRLIYGKIYEQMAKIQRITWNKIDMSCKNHSYHSFFDLSPDSKSNKTIDSYKSDIISTMLTSHENFILTDVDCVYKICPCHYVPKIPGIYAPWQKHKQHKSVSLIAVVHPVTNFKPFSNEIEFNKFNDVGLLDFDIFNYCLCEDYSKDKKQDMIAKYSSLLNGDDYEI